MNEVTMELDDRNVPMVLENGGSGCTLAGADSSAGDHLAHQVLLDLPLSQGSTWNSVPHSSRDVECGLTTYSKSVNAPENVDSLFSVETQQRGGAPNGFEEPPEHLSKGRYCLEYLSLENFKSYGGKHVIGPLSCNTAIVGPNGSGKSNIVDAICFGLGLNGSTLRSSSIAEVVHNGRSNFNLLTSTSVTLYFVQREPKIHRLVLGRKLRFRGRANVYTIDGRKVSYDSYRLVLQRKLGLNVHTLSTCLLLQGECSITAAARAPKELGRLMEQLGSRCSEDLSGEYSEAEKSVATLRQTSSNLLTKKQQLLMQHKIFRMQLGEARAYSDLLQIQRDEQVEYFLVRIRVCERTIKQQREAEREQQQREMQLQHQLQVLRREAEASDQDRINVSLQMDQKRELTRLKVMKTNVIRNNVTSLLEKIRFWEKRRHQLQQELEQKLLERKQLADFENQLVAKLVCVRDEQQQLMKDTESFGEGLKQLLAEDRIQKLHEVLRGIRANQAQQQQHLLNRREQLRGATISLDLLERDCKNLDRNIKSALELKDEAHQKETRAMIALQQMLEEAKLVKKQLEEAKSRVQASAIRRSELLPLQQNVQQQLCLTRGLQRDSQQHLKLLRVHEELRINSGISGILRAVSQSCNPVQRKVNVAVAASLGRWTNALIVTNVQTAVACMEYLRRNRLGTVEFLPLDRIREKQIRCRVDGTSFADGGGFGEDDGAFLPPPPSIDLPLDCKWAVDCVQFEPALRPIFEFILSDCIVAPTLDVAQELKDRNGSLRRYRYVTHEGEKLYKVGVISVDANTQNSTTTGLALFHQQQHDSLVRSAEMIRRELHEIDEIERNNSDSLTYKQQQFERLQRQCRQQQVKQKAWEQQEQQKDRILQQMKLRRHQLMQKRDEQQQLVTDYIKGFEQMESSVADAETNALREFAQTAGVPLTRLRTLLPRDQQREQECAAAKMQLQTVRLDAELRDCRAHMEAVTSASDTINEQLKAHGKDEYTSLQRQLQEQERQLVEAEAEQHNHREEKDELERKLKHKERAMTQFREQIDDLTRSHTTAAANVTVAQQKQVQQKDAMVHLLRQADASNIQLPLKRGTWHGVQAVAYANEGSVCTSVEGGAVSETEKDFVFDFDELSAEKRRISDENLGSPECLKAEFARYEERLRRRRQQLEEQQPNLKVEEKLRHSQLQLQNLEKQQQHHRKIVSEAETNLRNIKKRRRDAFINCFTHCKKAFALLFSHLTSENPHEIAYEEHAAVDTNGDPVSTDVLVRRCDVNSNSGQAFLDLQSPSPLTIDEEPFSCEVNLVCMFPGKRYLTFSQLSGGEQHVVALALSLALNSYNPRLPFLVFDEVDAHLDRSRLVSLSSLINRITGQRKTQCLVVTFKEKLFSAADLLVGVARDPSSCESRCFHLSLGPYHNRRAHHGRDLCRQIE